MRCQEAVDRLSALLDGELTSRNRSVVQQHLDGCSSCFETFLQTKMDSNRVRAVLERVRPDGEEVTDSAMDRIRSEDPDLLRGPGFRILRPGSLGSRARRALRASLVPVAAFLALLFLTVSLLPEGPEEDPMVARGLAAHEPDRRTRAQDRTAGDAGVPAQVPGSRKPAKPPATETDQARLRVEEADALSRATSHRVEIGDPVPGEDDPAQATPADLISRLLTAFHEGDLKEAERLAAEFGGFADDFNQALNALENELLHADTNSELRGLLLKAMASLGGEPVLRLLMRMLGEEESTLNRQLMVEFLSRNPFPDSGQTFLSLLANEDDPIIRQHVIEALGHIGTREAFEGILEALFDPDAEPSVRDAAIHAMAKIRKNSDVVDSEDLIDAFEHVVNDGKETINLRVLAFDKIFHLAGDHPRARDLVRRLANSQAETDLRARAHRYLADYDNPKRMERLRGKWRALSRR